MKNFLLLALCFSHMAYANLDFSYSKNSFGTHQPILYQIVSKTTGPVIEFGCGHGSTDLLHELCKQQNRILVTIEDDLAWLNMFREKYRNDGYSEDNSGWHKMYFVPGKKENSDLESPIHWIRFFQKFELLQQLKFDVCFIDQSPWLARYETIKLMKNKARYVVLHDFDYFPGNRIFGTVIKAIDTKQQVAGEFDFSDIFLYFKAFFPPHPWPGETGPPTLVGSNFESDVLNLTITNL